MDDVDVMKNPARVARPGKEISTGGVQQAGQMALRTRP
jgi:hypothetical protein